MIDFKNIDTISHILKDTSINSLTGIKKIKLSKKESDIISSLYDVFHSSIESNQKIQFEIENSDEIQLFIVSQYIVKKIQNRALYQDIKSELEFLFQKLYSKTIFEAEFDLWNSKTFDMFENQLPKSLKASLTKFVPTKLVLLCIDNLGFLNINGVTPKKLDDFNNFKNELLENTIINKKNELIDSTNFDDEEDILENIKTYFTILCNHLENDIEYYFDKMTSSRYQSIEIVKDYIFSTLNFKELSSKYNINGERVRQLITTPKEFPFSICSNYAQNQDDYKLKFEGNLLNTIIEQLESNVYNTSIGEEFEINENNFILFERYLKLLQYDLVSFNNDEHSNIYVLIKSQDYKIGDFRKIYDGLIQVLKNTVSAISFEEIKELLSKDLIKRSKNKKIVINESILKKLLECYPFQIIVSENEELVYQIQPNLLSSLMLKVERILLQNEVPMSRSEILEQLNIIQEKYSDAIIEDSNFFIKRNVNVQNLSNNYWIHSDFFEGNNRKKPIDFIDEIIRKKSGKIGTQEIIDEIKKHHYTISDSSVRTYLTQLCYISKDNRDLFIHRDFISKFPNIEVKKERNYFVGKDIIQEIFDVSLKLNLSTRQKIKEEVFNNLINNEIQVTENQIYGYIEKFIKIKILLEVDNLYYLDKSKSIEDIEYRKEPLYKTNIIANIVNDLKENSDGILLNDLFKKYNNLLPEGIKKNIFYKIINECELFQKVDKDSKTIIQLKRNLLPKAEFSDTEILDSNQTSNTVQIPIEKEKIFDLDELNNIISNKVSLYFESEVVFKSKFKSFVKILENTNNGKVILNYINKIYLGQTDYYDRFAYLSKIIYFYEPYLKVLGCEPNQDYPLGLSNVIHSNSKLKYMFYYQKNNTNSYYKEKDLNLFYFSKNLNELIFLRNKLAHDMTDDALDQENLNHIDLITKFIALYIYTTQLLN